MPLPFCFLLCAFCHLPCALCLLPLPFAFAVCLPIFGCRILPFTLERQNLPLACLCKCLCLSLLPLPFPSLQLPHFGCPLSHPTPPFVNSKLLHCYKADTWCMGCTQVMAVDEIPLAYLPGGVVRLHVKVVGDLQIAAPPAPSTKPSTSEKKSDLQKPHQPALQKQDAQQRRKLPEQQPGAPRTPQQQSPIGKTLTVPDSGSPVPETHQHSEPQDPDPSELQRLDPSDPHYSDPSKAQPDPYGPHHQSPSLPHPDPYEPNDLDLSKAHHPEPSSQALVSQPDHMTSAVPGNEAAGKLQTTNVTSFAPDLSSAASELHHPRPSDPHRPHPFATHQPTPSDPHHPNPSQDCLTAVSTSAASPAHTASAISSSEADLAPLSPRELSQSGGSMGATTAGWVITKTHVEALAIGNNICTCWLLCIHASLLFT